MSREINLEEIIDSVANLNTDEDNNPIYYLWEVKKAMKEACERCLDLAAENINVQALEDFGSECPYCWSENSILQIKNWIK